MRKGEYTNEGGRGQGRLIFLLRPLSKYTEKCYSMTPLATFLLLRDRVFSPFKVNIEGNSWT